MKRIRVGIIGQGRSGRDIHAATLLQRLSDRYELAAVCDLDPTRCRESHDESGCATFTDFQEMLQTAPLDLVVNATPSNQHEAVSIAIMDSGHAVLSEKPLGRTVASVDRQLAAAQRNRTGFYCFQQSRFAPTFRKVLEVMNSGVLGRPVMVKVFFNNFARRWDWQTLQEYDGGNLLNTGPHPLDQALQLFGDVDPEEIFCVMDRANTYGDAEDHVKLVMRRLGHPTVDLEISSCAAYSPYVYMLYGTRGSLSGTHERLEWKYFVPEEAPPRQLIRTPLEGRQYCSDSLSWYNASWESSPEGLAFPGRVQRYYEMLYETIVNGAPLEVTPEQVRRQIAVIEECHRQNPLSRLEA